MAKKSGFGFFTAQPQDRLHSLLQCLQPFEGAQGEHPPNQRQIDAVLTVCQVLFEAASGEFIGDAVSGSWISFGQNNAGSNLHCLNPFTISPSRQRSPHVSHGPADAVEQVLLEALILPDLFAMAQGGIEHSAAAKRPRPGECEVTVGAIHAGHAQIH